MQHQEFRLQVNVLFLEALLSQGHGVVVLGFLPAALLSQGWTFILQAQLISYSSYSQIIIFWESSGHLGFWFGHCSAWNNFRRSVHVLAVFQLKRQTKKTCLKTFHFYPGAKFNLFMQLAVVLETELELYLHINILIAGRILGLKTVRADRVRVQNNGRIIVSLLCCLF